VLIIKLYPETKLEHLNLKLQVTHESTHHRIQKPPFISFISNLKKLQMQLNIPALLTFLAATLVAANPIPTAASANSKALLEDIYGGTCYQQSIDTLACKIAGRYPTGCCCSDLKKFASSCGLPGPPYSYSNELKKAMKKCNSKC